MNYKTCYKFVIPVMDPESCHDKECKLILMFCIILDNNLPRISKRVTRLQILSIAASNSPYRSW